MIRKDYKYSYLASENIGCTMKVTSTNVKHHHNHTNHLNQKNHSSDIIFLSMTISTATILLDSTKYTTKSTCIALRGSKVEAFAMHVCNGGFSNVSVLDIGINSDNFRWAANWGLLQEGCEQIKNLATLRSRMIPQSRIDCKRQRQEPTPNRAYAEQVKQFF